MYRRVLAFDYDGTLARNDSVPLALQQELEHLHEAGYALFLVTGRRFESINLGSLNRAFTGIVWENGAVVCRAPSKAIHMPFGFVAPHVVDALDRAGVPLEHGLAIVSTWVEHEKTVWRVLAEMGGDIATVRNRDALMIVPPGATKGTGLECLLQLCGYSARNLVSFGDAENDVSLLQVGELGVAVGDAVPSLQEIAALVAGQPGPQGVLEVLETYWRSDNPPDIPSRPERWIRLGNDTDDSPFFLAGTDLIGKNLGVFGDTGVGKSWVTGLLAEGVHLSGYQCLLVDPEGNFRGLRVLPKVVVLEGDQHRLPSPAMVATLLEEAPVSVVLDLCTYPVSWREQYIADLLRVLRLLKERKFRPHWIVMEEAQYFLAHSERMLVSLFEPLMVEGGCAVVSYRPDRMAQPVLAQLDRCVLARLSEPAAVQTVCEVFEMVPTIPLAEIPKEHVLLDGEQLLRPAARRVEHVRHLYKYLDMPLPRQKRFYFRDEDGYLGLEAASLFEFKQILADLSLSSLHYHLERGDFAAWAKTALGDDELASQLEKLAHRALDGESLRETLVQRVVSRYTTLHAQR